MIYWLEFDIFVEDKLVLHFIEHLIQVPLITNIIDIRNRHLWSEISSHPSGSLYISFYLATTSSYHISELNDSKRLCTIYP